MMLELLDKPIHKVDDLFHLLTGKIHIKTDKPIYAPGDKIVANISLKFQKPIKARAVVAELSCHEHQRIVEKRTMLRYDYELDRERGMPRSTNVLTTTKRKKMIKFKQVKKISGEAEYHDHELNVHFDLPADAYPTTYVFGHNNRIHKWFLKVKLDVPFSVDKNKYTEIRVRGLSFA